LVKINPDTLVFGIIGYPLSHSLSPIMHNKAFEYKGINAIYLYFPCKKIEGVVSGMKSLSIKGLSVTIPHKEKICEYLDEIEPIAEKIKAVNTLVNKGDLIVGYNTDAYGAIRALKDKTKELKEKKALIIGAGGAARAIAFALKEEKAYIIIANRTKHRGETLAKEIDAEFLPFSDIKKSEPDIIIQTTPVGMYPEVDKVPVFSEEIFRKRPLVMDIVYNPLETKFLKMAKKKGCEVIPGVEMFVYQGARQFEIWTGAEAPIQFMKDTVISFLKGEIR